MSNIDTSNTKFIASGFFNSLEGTNDRMYDAKDFGQMFDGVILDGVFSSFGDKFIASPGGGWNINIGSGRSWFNHIWAYNNTTLSVEINSTPMAAGFKRIDAVVLEINTKEEVRQACIKSVMGIAAEDEPTKPEMIKDAGIYQYPLCYISIDTDKEEITEDMIENAVGKDLTPFVSCPLEHVSAEELLKNLEASFIQYQEDYLIKMREKVDKWYETLENELDDNQAMHLQNEIDSINRFLGNIGNAEEVEY